MINSVTSDQLLPTNSNIDQSWILVKAADCILLRERRVASDNCVLDKTSWRNWNQDIGANGSVVISFREVTRQSQTPFPGKRFQCQLLYT